MLSKESSVFNITFSKKVLLRGSDFVSHVGTPICGVIGEVSCAILFSPNIVLLRSSAGDVPIGEIFGSLDELFDLTVFV